MDENKSIAEAIGLEGYAQQNPEVKHLLEMLNSQNISFDDYVKSDPELAATMKMLTEDNIRLDVDRSDVDTMDDSEERVLSEDEVAAELEANGELSDDSTGSFTEDATTSAAATEDLNSIF